MGSKQREGCVYWQSGNGDKQCFRFCHYMLYTGEMRKRDGDRCYSRSTKRRKRRRDPFDVPIKQQ